MDLQKQDKLLLFNFSSQPPLSPDKGSAKHFLRRRKPIVLDNRIVLPTRSHLSQNHFFFADSTNRPGSRFRRRHAQALRTCWAADSAEGRDLAHSNTPLPSDQYRNFGRRPLLRQPLLMRQEAFRDPSTCKPRLSLSSSAFALPSLSWDELGNRSPAFGLNAISHDQPVYSLRLAKRRHKMDFEASYEMVKPLELNLCLADLQRDEAIARFLVSPSPSEFSQLDREDFGGLGDPPCFKQDKPHRSAIGISTPLRIIYELIGASKSGSQPPQPSSGSAMELFPDLGNDSVDDDLVQRARAMSLFDPDQALDDSNFLDGSGWAVVGSDPDADYDPSLDVTVSTPGLAAGTWIFLGEDS